MITPSDFLKWCQVFNVTRNGGGGGGGDGNVVGTPPSTDNAITRYIGTSGKIIKNSDVIIDDDGNVSTSASMSMSEITVTNLAYLPEVNPIESYVSSAGNDELGDGSITNPFLTVEHADSVAVDLVNIQAGTFLEGPISAKLAAWAGIGKNITQVSCGLLNLNDAVWQAATTPYKLIQDLTIFNGSGAGTLIGLTLTNVGSGYTSAPTVGFTGGGGTGAAATAIVGFSIASVAVTSAGSYSEFPTITATLGSGATFTSTLKAQTVIVVDGGSNYTPGNKIVVTGGTLTGSVAATLNIDSVDGSGAITSLSVDSGGQYSVLPSNPIAAANNYANCDLATTGALLLADYASGPSPTDPGVGATLTNAGIINRLQIDGIPVDNGMRILNWTMGDGRYNGIYTVTNAGSSSSLWVLTRATDFDQPVEITRYNRVGVTSGNTYAGQDFYVTTSRPVQIGSVVINFGLFYGSNAQFAITGWGLQSISVTAGGSNYETGSALDISGSGAGAGTVTLASSGNIKSVSIINSGSGYTSAPTVGFTGGGGTGAAATAIVSPAVGSMNFTPSAYKSGSAYIFNNTILPSRVLLSLVSNVIFEGNSEASNLTITDVTDFYSSNSVHAGTLTFKSVNSSAVPAMSIDLQNCEIETITINPTGASSSVISVKIQNCENLSTININNQGSSGILIKIDPISFRAATVNVINGTYELQYLEPTFLSLSTVLALGSGVAPNLNSSSTQEVMCVGPSAGATIPNSPANPARSMFVGYNCGAAYTTSGNPNDNHCGVGYLSLRNMTTAYANTSVGSSALFSLTTSPQNTAVGSFAGGLLKTGTGQNVMIGLNCGVGVSNSSYTKASLMGYQAGQNLSTADQAICIGYNAGVTISSGSNNTIIGSSADVSTGAASNRTVIGQGAIGSIDNQVVLGNSSVTSIVSNSTSAALGTTANPFSVTHSKLPIVTETTTSRTLSATDIDTYLRTTNNSAVTITVPSGVYAVGQSTAFYTAGAGQVSFAASGVTINSKLGNLKTNTTGSPAFLICVATNIFDLSGDLSV